jgi:hypothetical protein
MLVICVIVCCIQLTTAACCDMFYCEVLCVPVLDCLHVFQIMYAFAVISVFL